MKRYCIVCHKQLRTQEGLETWTCGSRCSLDWSTKVLFIHTDWHVPVGPGPRYSDPFNNGNKNHRYGRT